MRLVKKFEHIRVAIHNENGPQLHFVALELDRDSHFRAWVRSAHVVSARSHATNGLRSTNAGQQITR